MKKKVAVFANGWSNEYLELTIEGMRKRADEENIDLFVFVNYSAGEDDNERDNIGERGMFTLPNLSRFDGVAVDHFADIALLGRSDNAIAANRCTRGLARVEEAGQIEIEIRVSKLTFCVEQFDFVYTAIV